MADHYVAAGAWLVLSFGLIAFAAKSGIERSQHAAHGEEPATAHGHQMAGRQVSPLQREVSAAVAVAQTGRYIEAEEQLRRLTEKYPDSPSVWLNLGIALIAQNKLTEADAAFNQALQLDPNDYDALAERAGIAKQQGRVEDALGLLERIPAGKGRMRRRLIEDPLWADLKDNPRMQQLWERHRAGRIKQEAIGEKAERN